MGEDPKWLAIQIGVVMFFAVLITIVGGRKERAKKRVEWEKLVANKTKQEINSYIIGDLLVFIGVAGMIIGAISDKQGAMSKGFVVLGAIFSFIGGGMIKKRMDQIKKKIDEAEAGKKH